MQLYLFNPSHDEALAAGTPYYYPTTIARRLAVEWGGIPALWAGEGNAVLVPDEWNMPSADESDSAWCRGIRFVRRRELHADFWQKVTKIEPWGWDSLVRQQLRKARAPEHLLPDDATLENVRSLSSRETTVRLLPLLLEDLQKSQPVVGQSRLARSVDEVEQNLNEWQGAMVKSLWSCSGRGVFRVPPSPSASNRGRINRLLREQGAIEMEPFYTGIMDFALEFQAHADGTVTYQGLSFFQTNPLGGYSGNVIDRPEHLQQHVSEAMGGAGRLENLIRACLIRLPQVLDGKYQGPLGIDQMLVTTSSGPALLPCVEVNVRRTMGHVALSLIQRKLKEEDLPAELRKLWYFCNKLC